ncbi:MAG: glycosyltransferase family 1 protein [Acidimicrobiia bacterium]
MAMRILLDVSAVPDRPVGAGVYTVELARALAARDDVELHLVSRVGDLDRWEAIAPAATTHPEAPGPRPARLAWEQVQAPRFAQRCAIDVWHGPHYTMPLRLGIPSVVTVHDLTFFDHPEWHERSKVLFFRRMIRESASRARVLVTVSEFTARRLRAVVVPAGEIAVVPHGVDHARFRPAPEPADGAHDHDLLHALGAREPYLAFAGVFEPRKDLPTLVRAFAAVARRHRHLQLVLAGRDGWGSSAARDAVERSRVGSRILRPGYVAADALPALFRRAAAVVYPSLEEGFGLPALEAMACGTPLVSTSGSSIEEVVGPAGVLVPPGDADALAVAIERVLSDRALAARLRADGPERARRYNWEATAAGHLDAYRTAVGVPA